MSACMTQNHREQIGNGVSGLGTWLGPHPVDRARRAGPTRQADDPPASRRDRGQGTDEPARGPATGVDSPGKARPLESSLHIAVDFDGVLFDHIPYVLRGFRDAHGIDLAEEGLRYWDFFQYRAVREKGLTWRSVRDVLDDIETDPVLHRRPPRDPQAAEVMAAWVHAGHRVEVVTARGEQSREVTELFLERHDIPHHELVMEASRKLGYDLLIDDSPHNVLMAAADGSMSLLMDHPYNKDVPARSNPLRVRTWTDVEQAVGISHPLHEVQS